MDSKIVSLNKTDAMALDKLLNKCSKPNMVIIELGASNGRSSLNILPHVQRMDGMLYCIDVFADQSPGAVPTRISSSETLNAFLSNIKEANYEGYVNVFVGTSDNAASIFADDVADLIFIDGDHRYYQIRNDILNYYPKLKDGGIICGPHFDRHIRECDYEEVLKQCGTDAVNGSHYGIIRAVCEFFPDVEWEGTIWYAQKKPHPRPALDSVLAIRRAIRDKGLALKEIVCKVITTALAAKERGDFITAIAILEQLTYVRPDLLDGHLYLGSILKELNMIQQVVSVFKRAVKVAGPRVDPHTELYAQLSKVVYTELYTQLGDALYRSGDKAAAETYFQAALRFDPASMGAWLMIIRIYIERGHNDKAKEYLKHAIRLTPSDLKILTVLGELSLKLSANEAARMVIERVEKITPDAPIKFKIQNALNTTQTVKENSCYS